MRGFPKKRQLAVVLFLIFGMSSIALGKSPKKTKKSKGKNQLSASITEAMRRSDTDQKKIRIRFDDEATDRIESWKDRKLNLIEIKHTGTTSVAPVDLGDPDYSFEESGEDQSGLNSLHSDIEEESTDINFDEELRDVSSLKD